MGRFAAIVRHSQRADEHEEFLVWGGMARQVLVRASHRIEVQTSGPYDRDWADLAEGEMVTILTEGESATAPELLAACKAALPWVAIALAGQADAHPDAARNHAEDLARLRAAIAAAEGRDPGDAARGDGAGEG